MVSHATAVKGKAAVHTGPLVGPVRGKHAKSAKTKPGGKIIDWDEPGVHKRYTDELNKHVTPKLLEELELTRSDFDAAMEELRKRSAGARQTPEQLVGTFFEIIGARHGDVASMRDTLVNANLESALHAAFTGRGVFLAAGGDVTVATAMTELLDNIEWTDGGALAKQLLGEFAAKKTALADRKVGDENLAQLIKRIKPSTIEKVRDLYIDGNKYCDGAVLLRLRNGKALLLVSEEYKAPKSGGIRSQQAVRNNRLFNDAVQPDSKFEYFDAKHQRQSLDLGNLLLNCDTVANDQFGVKAAVNNHDVEALFVKATQSVVERKRKYGESLRPRRDVNTIFFYIKLSYPSGLVRKVLTQVHSVMPK